MQHTCASAASHKHLGNTHCLNITINATFRAEQLHGLLRIVSCTTKRVNVSLRVNDLSFF